jgi:RHS repeat-associated protein
VPSRRAAAAPRGPDGQFLGQSWSATVGLTLPRAGTYTLAVISTSQEVTGAVPYNLDVLAPATNTTTLTDDTVTGGTISTPGQRNQYTFSGAAGDLVFLAGPSSSTNTVTAQLTGPEGQYVGVFGNATLLASGTYTLTITGAQPDSYQFRLAESAAAPLLTPDTQVTGTFQSSLDGRLYRFAGTASERVVVTGTVSAIVYSALDGQELTTANNEAVLPRTGTYLLAVTSNPGSTYPLNYSFNLKNLTPTALTLGTTYSGTLSAVHDQQLFTFTATTGQELYLNDLGGSSGSLPEVVTGPDGKVLGGAILGSDRGLFRITTDGTYTLVVYAPATYNFRMLDASAAPTLALGTPLTGTLNPGTQTALYTLQGRAGQRLSFQNPTGPGLSWQLIGPADENVAQGGQAFLPTDGPYVLAVRSTSTSGPVHYSFMVTDVSDTPVPASGFGPLRTGTLAAGATTSFTFTASAGLPVYLDNQDPSSSSISFALRGPSVSVVLTTGGSADQGPLVLPQSGTYTLLVENGGSATTNLRFRLLDLSAVPALPLGSTASGTLDTGAQTDVYRLPASGGESFVTDPFQTDLSNVTVTVWYASTTVLNAAAFPPVFNLPYDGTYYVTVTGTQAGPAGYSIRLDAPAALPALTSGTSLAQATAPLSFGGTAGQRLYFANQTTNPGYGYNLALYGPDGGTISGGQVAQLGNGFLVTLPTTGTYVLFPFTATPGTPAAYTFQFNEPATTTSTADVQTGPSGERITYDPVFNEPTSIIDFLGHTTLFQIDPQTGNVLSMTQLAGTAGTGDVVTHYTYTASGQVQTVTDPLGRVTQASYDSLGRATQVTYAAGTADQASVEYAYDATGNTTSWTDEDGRTTTYEYDPLNRPVSTTDPLGNLTQSAYDAAGNLVQVTDALGHVTRYTYNGANNQASTTTAEGAVTQVQYDPAGNVAAETDALGRQTQYQYDARERLIVTSDAAGGRTSQTYDHADNVLTTTDADGRTTSYSYDARNRLTSETDPLGHTTSFARDAHNNLVAVTDANGHTTTDAFDDLNRLVHETDPLGGVQTFTYDAAGNVTARTDALGNTTAYAYDNRDRLIAMTDALGNVTRDTYDPAGNLLTVTDPRGNSTAYTYDGDNRLTATTDALGHSGGITYDAAGNVIATTDELGRKTTHGYDVRNRLTTTTDPLGGTTTTAYDAVGNVTSTTDPLGHKTRYGYDALDRLTTTTDALGNSTSAAYDPVGNVVSTTDELGRTVNLAYDADNRLTSVTDALGNVTSNTYDAVGNELSTTDPLGRTTAYAYDANDRLTSTTDANGAVTKDTYDAAGNLTGITDPVGNSTTYAYDKLNRVVTDTSPLGTRTYQYGAAGDLASSTDRDGRTIHYAYDQLNRATSETWLEGSGHAVDTFTYSYDAASQLISAGDASSAYEFTYDANGRETSVSNTGTPAVPMVMLSYSYDAAGNVLSRSDKINGQAAGTTSYAYDALDRETQVSQSGPGVTAKRVDFAYDAVGEMTGITRYADLAGAQQVAASQYTYDKDGRLTALTHVHGSTTLAAYTWNYDAASRVTTATSPDGKSTYSYDKTGQLTAAVHAGQADESYSYDANGNRTNPGYKTGPDNEVLSDGTYNYAYDADGNLVRQTNIATGAVTDYSYDYRNRLTQVTFKDGAGNVLKDVTYTYDVFNNRIGETVTMGSATTAERFVYDGSQVALTFDGGGNLTHRYLYGPGQDQVLADDNGQGQALWPLTDNLGSVRDIIDSAGAIEDHLVYDSFGNITSQTNAAIDFLFGYTGQQLDRASGLYYDQARFYNAALGRFMSQDPIGFTAGDPNPYRYVSNSPTNGVDPSGLQGITCDFSWLKRFLEALQQALEAWQSLQPPQLPPPPQNSGSPGFVGGSGQATTDPNVSDRKKYWDLRAQQLRQRTEENWLKEAAWQFVPLFIPEALVPRILSGITRIPGVGPILGKIGSSIIGKITQAARPVLKGAATKLEPVFIKARNGLQAILKNVRSRPAPVRVNIPAQGHHFNQIAKRGWTNQSIVNTVRKPFTTRMATNKATGNPATAYFNKDGSHVIVDDVSGDLVQISDRTNIANWIPDPSIINPYIPPQSTMSLTKMQEQFAQVALRRGSVFLLSASDSLRFVDECERNGVDILGVEGFKVFGEKIQPVQEHSFDMRGEKTNNHAIAREFIQQRVHLDIWFEVGTSEGEGCPEAGNSDSG